MNQLTQKNYYRIMLGRKSIFAKECYEGKWIGAGWLNSSSLENELVESWRDFNKKFIPNYLSTYDGSSKVAAGTGPSGAGALRSSHRWACALLLSFPC